ncbi:MAG: M20/M25/M40 family metallo-hydrolase [Firmicutes bacterium]|nr:M20/M25/M40 family metallo-hydrolase [Bacillota bacterium]
MINFNERAFLRELQYLVNIDSGPQCLEGLDKMADFYMEKYGKMGMKVEKKVFDPVHGPCVEVRSHGDEKAIDLLLLCHMDTVFPEGSTARRPFYIAGDKAFGPGVADMKSGSLMACTLTEKLLESRPDLRICVALNCDNEIGAVSSREWLWELARNSRFCLGFECGRPDGSFVKRRKGAAHYSIKMYGKSAHAGIDPRGGASAVLEMANWICRFADFDRLPLDTSLNFGVVQGGSMYNVIPDYAEAKVDIRFQTEEQLEMLTEEIRDLCSCPYNPEIKVSAKCLARSFPMVENEISEKLMAIMEEEGEKLEMEVHFSSSGGASDASIASTAGAGAVDACGPVGFNSHNEKEYILISSIAPRLELLINVCKRL